jgi:AAA domain
MVSVTDPVYGGVRYTILTRHEHLYNNLQNYIIRSNEFSNPAVKRELQQCEVILCTLSMLSNERLLEKGFTQTVPINTLIVDEASQIEVGDYTAVFSTFKSTLRKICFIGDDKQCQFI